MSVSQESFRKACGHFATGVAILATRTADGTPHGLTINSFASLSLDPPLVMVAIAHSSAQLSAFDVAPSFTVSFLREDQQDLSRRFAQVQQERFSGILWTEGSTGAPLIQGAIASLECRIAQHIDLGDHRVLIGEAVEAHISAGRPLVFFRGVYASLPE